MKWREGDLEVLLGGTGDTFRALIRLQWNYSGFFLTNPPILLSFLELPIFRITF